jgi:hypothetical protein
MDFHACKKPISLVCADEMILADAEKISDHVVNLFASKPRHGFLRTSQLRGYSPFEISNAFALVIAKRRQIAGDDPALRRECREYADKAGTLVSRECPAHS